LIDFKRANPVTRVKNERNTRLAEHAIN